MAVLILVSFFVRNFYFTIPELSLGGATIGKRALGLRVISGDGGPVRADAIFARNLTRNMELFLLLTALLLPLTNKDRLRCGEAIRRRTGNCWRLSATGSNER